MKLPAFFFDIDGTLLDYTHNLTTISPKTQQALDKLRETHPTFIASGRTKCFIDKAILAYPFDGFVTCNGAYVEYQGKCIYKKKATQAALQKAVEIAQKYQAVLYLESRDKIYTYNADLPIHKHFTTSWGMREEIVATDFNLEEIEVYIGMIVADKEEDCQIIVDSLAPYFDVTRHVNQTSFDLTLKGINKAQGIAAVMAYFDSDLEMAWAFGDAYNDLEMISSVGHGIAMGNAVEPIKAIAYDVTDEAWHDGIVSCLKKYNWI